MLRAARQTLKEWAECSTFHATLALPLIPAMAAMARESSSEDKVAFQVGDATAHCGWRLACRICRVLPHETYINT